MRELSQKISFRSFLTIGSYETDPGFRALLASIARRGMFVYGLLGTVIVVAFVALHIFIGGKTPVWSYANFNPGTNLTLPDKTLIMFCCLITMFLSRKTLSLNRSRSVVFIVVWLISMSILLDDIGGQDISFSHGYVTIGLILAVATIPYKGWQAGVLTFTVIGSMLVTVFAVPGWLGLSLDPFNLSQVIYLFLIAFLLTGMSSQIYLHRFEQYRARRRAEELSTELEERAQVLKIMKEKSEKQAVMLLENEKLKDRFFANISHELRTPLTLILGPLKDLLPTDNEQTKVKVRRELLGLMHKNGRRLLDMIDQLLDLSKIDAGQISLNRQREDLTELVSEIVYAFAPLAESKKVTLTFSTDDKPVLAWIDAQYLEQAVGNLISNAIKFTPEGGAISISVSQANSVENNIQITVRDTGIGISESELSAVFDRFYQASHSSETFHKGTGIGLALVKEIVELHGGHVQVKSKRGQGSTFIIELPEKGEVGVDRQNISSQNERTPAEIVETSKTPWTENEAHSPKEAQSPQNNNSTILLIDDNPDILTYLQPRLSSQYKVVATEKSSEALELIRAQPVDLIVSDVRMPEPDGFELCQIIKEDPELNHIPVILLTAQAAEESRIEGLELGADDYISKPFSAAELMVRVENLIELRRMLQDKFSQRVQIEGKEVDVSSEDARFLQQVQSVIEKHMANSNFGVDWLAEEVNLSSRQLQRKLQSIINLSAGGYIRMIRLERAGQLLKQQWGNVSEIAYAVGFNDPRYFSKLFKKTFGATPSGYADEKK